MSNTPAFRQANWGKSFLLPHNLHDVGKNTLLNRKWTLCVDCGGIVLQSAKTPGTDKEKSVTHLYPQGPITLSRLGKFRNFHSRIE
jgi:hypothetical protein